MYIRQLVLLLFVLLSNAKNIGLKISPQNSSSTVPVKIQNISKVPLKYNLQAKLISSTNKSKDFQIFINGNEYLTPKDLNIVLSPGQETTLNFSSKTQNDFYFDKDITTEWAIGDWPAKFFPTKNLTVKFAATKIPKVISSSITLANNCGKSLCSKYSNVVFKSPKNLQYQITENSCPEKNNAKYLSISPNSDISSTLNQLSDGQYNICFFNDLDSQINSQLIHKDSASPTSQIPDDKWIITRDTGFTVPYIVTDTNPDKIGVYYSRNLDPFVYQNSNIFKNLSDGLYFFDTMAIDKAGNIEKKNINSYPVNISQNNYSVMVDTTPPTTNLITTNFSFTGQKDSYDYQNSPLIDITNPSFLIINYQSNILDYKNNFLVEIYDSQNKLLDTVISLIEPTLPQIILYPLPHKNIKIMFKNFSDITISDVSIYHSTLISSIGSTLNFQSFDTGSGLYQTTPSFVLSSGENIISYFSTDIAGNVESTHSATIRGE